MFQTCTDHMILSFLVWVYISQHSTISFAASQFTNKGLKPNCKPLQDQLFVRRILSEIEVAEGTQEMKGKMVLKKRCQVRAARRHVLFIWPCKHKGKADIINRKLQIVNRLL